MNGRTAQGSFFNLTPIRITCKAIVLAPRFRSAIRDPTAQAGDLGFSVELDRKKPSTLACGRQGIGKAISKEFEPLIRPRNAARQVHLANALVVVHFDAERGHIRAHWQAFVTHDEAAWPDVRQRKRLPAHDEL